VEPKTLKHMEKASWKFSLQNILDSNTTAATKNGIRKWSMGKHTAGMNELTRCLLSMFELFY
jgi:hypothetical protein